MTHSFHPHELERSGNQSSGPELHVLVIDDQRFQRSFLVKLLRDIGVQTVSEACNGKNALELLIQTTTPVDLIICDIDMPKMDGLEFLRWLGTMAPQMPVLIHSALELALLHSVEAMAVEYNLKPLGILEDPVTAVTLAKAIERAQIHVPRQRALSLTIDKSTIERGLEHKEFEPWFQPKMDLRTGRVIGVEALLRWRRGQHILLPDRFLEPLEAAGFSRECTLRVATRAAECINLILDRGKHFTVAINVAPSLLDDPSFAADLATALGSAGAQPEQIIIEIAEVAMTRNPGALLENLARLRMRGFRISLDDFCTGNSSLARLINSPFSEIKIDRSFIGRMYPGNREWLLIESTITLAQHLGLKTVAEGIEADHQLQSVKRFGCDSAQGTLIAKPMPVLELMRWMEQSHKEDDSMGDITHAREPTEQSADKITFESASITTLGSTAVAKDWLTAELRRKQ